MSKGLVLLNMGGPNNLDEVEMFLKNMFNDPNIITVKSDLLRKFIAFMIVASRKNEAKGNYEKLGGKSPLVEYTKALVTKVQAQLPDTYVTFAMRYTPPFAKEAIEELKTHGVKEVFVLPLYPQYSTTTTKSSLEDFYAQLKASGLDMNTKDIPRFYQEEAYNTVLVQRIHETLADANPKEYDLIFSAHSLPQKIVDNGDPYQQEVLEHVAIISEMLAKESTHFKAIHTAYQSKLGPVKWLEPELGEQLKSMSNKKTIIVPISFVIDNSETEFELWVEYEEVAKELGFEDYRVVKCPNDTDLFVDALVDIYQKNS